MWRINFYFSTSGYICYCNADLQRAPFSHARRNHYPDIFPDEYTHCHTFGNTPSHLDFYSNADP